VLNAAQGSCENEQISFIRTCWSKNSNMQANGTLTLDAAIIVSPLRAWTTVRIAV